MLAEITPALTDRKITYVPFVEDTAEYPNITMANREDQSVKEVLSRASRIICIGRDSQPNPDYDEAYPERNILLTNSAASNVELSSQLYHQAVDSGNENVRIIATGRYNNRALDMEFAKPIVGEAVGMYEDDVAHLSVGQLKHLLDGKDLLVAKEVVASGDSREEIMARVAFGNILVNQGVDEDADPEEVRQAIVRQFADFPRISESMLMREGALAAGVPGDRIIEEPDSVDTISNLVNIVANEKAGAEDYRGMYDGPIVVVASMDHMPRTMWITDHVLPEGVEVLFVESDPRLPDDETLYAAEERELNSYRKGKGWIGDAPHDVDEIEKRVHKGYFSEHRKSAAQLAAAVKQQSTK